MLLRRFCSWSAVAALVLLSPVVAQSNSTSAAPSSTSASLSLTTSSFTSTFTTRSGTSVISASTVVPTVFNVTVTPTASSTSSAASNITSASATPTPDPRHLDTYIDPGFGVLGALLIITGVPSAFLGHKNRWYVHLLRFHLALFTTEHVTGRLSSSLDSTPCLSSA